MTLYSCQILVKQVQIHFLPSNNDLTHEVYSRSLSINFTNFDKKYERLSHFTLSQTFNLIPLSNDKLNKLLPDIPELKRVSFQHVNRILKEIDEKYPFVMPKSLVIIITVLGTIDTLIKVSTQ